MKLFSLSIHLLFISPYIFLLTTLILLSHINVVMSYS